MGKNWQHQSCAASSLRRPSETSSLQVEQCPPVVKWIPRGLRHILFPPQKKDKKHVLKHIYSLSGGTFFFFYLTFSDKLQLLPGKLQTRIPSLPMNITKDQFQPTEEDPN